MIDRVEVQRRSCQSFRILLLLEVALRDGSEQSWLGVFEELAAAERLTLCVVIFVQAFGTTM
jgi:hypothetical protein